MTLDLKHRVALVTGGGAGLGRSHALLLAQRGASVVVNGRPGNGGEDRVAGVVGEILAAGGQAVASIASIESAEGAASAVATALDGFGRLDILVHNAGFLRDRSFAKIDLDDFEAVIRVHLFGAVFVTKAAWATMLDQRYGRIVLTCSMAATSGNFGQSAYGSAKAGLIGLMNCLALEGSGRNILVNAVSPAAATAMTAGMFTAELESRMRPELVSPAIAWLASERCDVTGRLITAGAGGFGRQQIFENDGLRFGTEKAVSVEEFDAGFEKIDRLSGLEPTVLGSRIRAAFDPDPSER